ncbi:hypothetical protein JCM10213_007975 [Rhodosporidiobolus nylandii]
MSTPLISGNAASSGMLTGPTSDPGRYELLSELSGPSHPRLNSDKAPIVRSARGRGTGTLVAVKVLRKGASTQESSMEGEPMRLWRIQGFEELQQRGAVASAAPHAGRARCVAILDAFPLPHSDGTPFLADEDPLEDAEDAAMVLELLGPTLADWQKQRPSPFFPMSVVRRIVQQLLLALDYIHNELIGEEGIVHSGVSLGNILLAERYSMEDLAADRPATSPLVKLAGFSQSFWAEGAGDYYYPQPGDWKVASAEQLLLVVNNGNCPPARAVDIWAVGIVASLLLFNKNLSFHGFNAVPRYPGYTSRLDFWSVSPDVVLSLASLAPEAGWPSSLDEALCGGSADPDFPFNLPAVVPLPSIQQRIEAENRLSDPRDVEQLTSFLRASWTLDPYKRPSAKELLEHEWLRGVK